VADLVLYTRLVHAQVRGQLSYRLSFALNCVSQMFAQGTDLVAILVLFGRITSLGGFDVRQVLLIYSLSGVSFGLADLTVGSVELLPELIRTGRFDVLLMRPVGTLAQLVLSDFQLRRFGRAATALGVLVYILSTSDIQWTLPRVLLVVLTPLAGAVIFGSIFVLANSVCFWLIDGGELANTVTYGGSYFSSYPITVFADWLRYFLAYVVLGAFVAYYPALALLGKPDPLGAPQWLCWSGPAAAALAATVTGAVWRIAVRHYRGTGS